MELTQKLYYQGLTFYFQSIATNGDRIYTSLDEIVHYDIITAPSDYDGALIGCIGESFREDSEDDLIRYFDSVTGNEEV